MHIPLFSFPTEGFIFSSISFLIFDGNIASIAELVLSNGDGAPPCHKEESLFLTNSSVLFTSFGEFSMIRDPTVALIGTSNPGFS
jgi:hypothetical protein